MSERLRASDKRFYCVSFTVRSGSSLLCDDLTQWRLGEPTEYFQYPEPTPAEAPLPDRLSQLAETARYDLFGFKINWWQAIFLSQRLRDDPEDFGHFDLRDVFPDLKYIQIVRRDKIAQAVSAWRAERSGVWHWPVGDQVLPGRPDYDFYALHRHFQAVLSEEWLWEAHFAQLGIEPLKIVYEDYVADREGHLERVAEFLGAEPARLPLEDRLHVMRDDWTERTMEQFRADLHSAVMPADDPVIQPEPVTVGGGYEPLPDPAPPARRPRRMPRFTVPLAWMCGVAAADAALPNLTLAPLLIGSPLLALLYLPASTVALAGLLATLLVLPLAIADHIAGTISEVWITAGVIGATLLAIFLGAQRPRIGSPGRRRVDATGGE